MTQPPQGPPPGSGYPPPGSGYAPPGPGYALDPEYLPPPYPPGQEPIPPRPPRRGSPVIAPFLAFIALLVVAGASFGLVNYLSATIDTASATEASPTPQPAIGAGSEATEAPSVEPRTAAVEPTDEPSASGDPDAGVIDTPEPEEPETTAEPITVTPPSDERADVTGSILFTRLGGDVWSASGTTLVSLTNSSSTKADSNPTWSPDGKHIYFIRSTKHVVKDGKARFNGKYTLYPTDLMRMKGDGSGKKRIFDALIRDNRGQWFSHVVQPTVSSAGNNVAVVSDGNDGAANEVTLHIINSKSGRMREVDTPAEPAFSVSGFGHNDPDFSPDGTKIAFTYNDNAGTDDNPKIAVFTCQTKNNCTIGKEKYLKSGYANPSWSPDGNLLVVETTDDIGRDVAVITARGGHERVQLTFDGDSFAPEFSPNGDQIAYLHRDGLGIDVRVMTLEIDDKGKISLIDDRPVTSDGEIDGESGLSWHIPRSQLTERTGEGGADASDGAAETDASPDPDDASDEAPPPPPGS